MSDEITFREVLRHPQNYSNREIANAAIKNNIENGRLNLQGLSGDLNAIARERATHDPHYDDAVRSNMAQRVANRWNERYNEAVRDVLGLTDPGVVTSLQLMTGLLPQADHGLHCHVPANVTEAQLGNVENSLRQMGVTCDTNPSHTR